MPQPVVALNTAAILNVQFVNELGVGTDPVTVTLTITAPDGTVIVKNIGDLISLSNGRYQYHQDANQTGAWLYTFDGQGNGVDASDTDYFLAGVTLHSGLCEPWISTEDVFGCGPCSAIVDDDRNLALAAQMAQAASEFYWMHSGRQFGGLCDQTIRPCCHEMDCGRRVCGCPDPYMIALPRPTRAVLEVRVDGAVIDPTTYHVDQHRWLVRHDEHWPCCQDMTADPATDLNTFQVRIVRGTPPPEMGVLAARELACEMYQGCTGGDCAVPQRVTNIARQGVTMQFIRPEEVGISTDGKVRTGLRLGQLFLATYPGNKGRARPAIASPDTRPSSWRVTT